MITLDPTENQIQIALMAWIKLQLPHIFDYTIHIANQRKTSLQAGALLKKLGVKAGVSDIFIAWPTNQYFGLWLELKTHKGKLSAEQHVFMERMSKVGYKAMVSFGLDEAIKIIELYVSNKI